MKDKLIKVDISKHLPGPLELGQLPAWRQAVPASVDRNDPVAARHPVVDRLGQGDRGAGDAVEKDQGGGAVGPRNDARQWSHAPILPGSGPVG